jgi:hypothetical protein
VDKSGEMRNRALERFFYRSPQGDHPSLPSGEALCSRSMEKMGSDNQAPGTLLLSQLERLSLQ